MVWSLLGSILALGCGAEEAQEEVLAPDLDPPELIPLPSFTGEIGIEMVLVTASSFTRGCQEGTGWECMGEELPPHEVTLTRDYWIGTKEITQAQWLEVMGGENPSRFRNPDKPVETISWHDAIRFCNRLSEREGLSPAYTEKPRADDDEPVWTWHQFSEGYRLPTEAEWEYAARAGQQPQPIELMRVLSWYRDNSPTGPHPAGSLPPNAWGLYDVTGNVWEWTWDLFGDYLPEPVTNPEGNPGGSRRVTRGGSWDDLVKDMSTTRRGRTQSNRKSPVGGLRVVRTQMKGAEEEAAAPEAPASEEAAIQDPSAVQEVP